MQADTAVTTAAPTERRPPPPGHRPTSADLGASVVVFLVALPLCLGIALASGAPLISGVLAGIVGGLVIGALSPSAVQVSGPAAGLTAIVLAAVATQGSYPAVLPAITLAGAMQIAFGLLKGGIVARFVPSAVIKGMLAAIGLILIFKQLPHLVGWDADAMGDGSFLQADDRNTFSELLYAARHIHPGAAVVGIASLTLSALWARVPVRALRRVPAPLAVVVFGTVLAQVLAGAGGSWLIEPSHRVALPLGGFAGVWAELPRPDWSVLGRMSTWSLAGTLAIVASLESLLSLEASVKLDSHKREPSPDRELFAQGVGNLIAGLIGAMPMTGVIVRTSANIDSGADTRWSAIIHGAWLMLALLVFPQVLNVIPLAALAAVLLHVGYRLARPKLFVEAWRTDLAHFVPFVITVIAILLTDLLVGISIGLTVGVVAILRDSLKIPALRRISPDGVAPQRFELLEQVTFLHKAQIIETLESLPSGTRLEIDGTRCHTLDLDVLEALHDFADTADERGVDLRLIGVPDAPGLGGH